MYHGRYIPTRYTLSGLFAEGHYECFVNIRAKEHFDLLEFEVRLQTRLLYTNVILLNIYILCCEK